LELITTTLEPPDTFENIAMFEPKVAVPTVSVLDAIKLVVEMAFDAYMLPVTVIRDVVFESVSVFAKILTVEMAFDANTLPTTCSVDVGLGVPKPNCALELKTSMFEPPEIFENTAKFDPRTVELAPTVTPDKIPSVPNVPKGAVNVSDATVADPPILRLLVT
jgi:hypothetical protein